MSHSTNRDPVWDVLDSQIRGDDIQDRRTLSSEETSEDEILVHTTSGSGQLETYKTIIRQLRTFGQPMPSRTHFSAEQSYHALHQKLGRTEPATLSVSVLQKSSKSLVAGRWSWMALSFVLLMAVGLIVTTQSGRRFGQSATAPASAFRAYTTEKGQRATVTLYDGTIVQLNVASRLLVPADYGVTSRTLILDGEAQFTVTHDSRKPFVVTAGGAVIKDLATIFGIRAYSGSGRTDVVVAHGKVDVSAKQVTAPRSVTLSRGDRATVTAIGTTEIQRGIDTDRELAWTRGDLVFQDTPVAEALGMLERWYNLQFEVSDPTLAGRHVTGVIRGQRLTDEVLRGLAETVGARTERRGNVITFKPIEAL